MSDILLRTGQLSFAYPQRASSPFRRRTHAGGGEAGRSRGAARFRARPGRRVRFGQDHARPAAGAAAAAELRRHPVRRRRNRRSRRGRDAAFANPHPDDFPGSAVVAEPAPAAGRDLDPAAAGARPPEGQPRPARPRRGLARSGRPAGRFCRPLSARTFRRPAPARRDRPRAGAGAGFHRCRRDRVRPRRLDPGAHSVVAAGAARATRPHPGVDQP